MGSPAVVARERPSASLGRPATPGIPVGWGARGIHHGKNLYANYGIVMQPLRTAPGGNSRVGVGVAGGRARTSWKVVPSALGLSYGRGTGAGFVIVVAGPGELPALCPILPCNVERGR